MTRRTITRATLAAVALALAAPLAGAQTAPTTPRDSATGDSTARGAPATAGWKPSVRLAYGPELDGNGAGQRRSGLVVAGLEWAQRGSRPGFRLDATYSRVGSDLSPLALGSLSCDGCRTEQRARSVGLSLDLKYEMGRRAVRPYVVSGVDLFRRSGVINRNFSCTPASGAGATATCALSTPVSEASRGFELGMHAGAGLALQLGGTQIFGEWRLQAMQSSSVRGRDFVPPLVFGVRF